MNDLSSLAALIQWANKNKVYIFDLGTRIEIQEPIEEAGYTRQWMADLQPIAADIIIGDQAQTIDGACRSLIKICKQQEIEISEVVDPETVIPYHQEVATLIANLDSVLPKLEKGGYLSLLFQYCIPPVSSEKAWWTGAIHEASKWSSYTEVEVDGDSLFEVCTKLWEECVKKLENKS